MNKNIDTALLEKLNAATVKAQRARDYAVAKANGAAKRVKAIWEGAEIRRVCRVTVSVCEAAFALARADMIALPPAATASRRVKAIWGGSEIRRVCRVTVSVCEAAERRVRE